VQSKSGSALAATRGEEGVEGATLDLLGHADSVIGHEDIDVVAHSPCLDDHASGAPVGKGMNDAVEEQVRQDLPIGSGITVHADAGRHIDSQSDLRLLEQGTQASDDLVGRFAQIERPPVRVAAVDCDLLERLHEFARALQVADELSRGIPPALEEFVEARAPQRT